MKQFLKFVVGIAIMVILAFPASKLQAQVLGEFTSIEIVNNAPYQSIEDSANTQVIGEQFALPPNYLTKDLDDGYYGGPGNAGLPLGFEYEFNGEIYDRIFINVNGFVTFGQKEDGVLKQPPFLALATRTPNALFFEDPTYPVNVIAPFWGDHKFRTTAEAFSGYAESSVMYLAEADKFTVEWKDLNINYNLNGEFIKSSVGNFQLIIYKSVYEFSKQGDIEFAYGQVNTNNNSGDTRVITKGASVGVKGEGIVSGGKADYLNALLFGDNFDNAHTSEILTQAWTPSGGTDKRIRISAAASSNVEEFWGDGDVDYSKAAGNKHFGLSQSRYVTVNDIRIVLNSVATGIPLDPVRRRAAYHGDVNHDGRYYIDDQGVRKNVYWRNKHYSDSLPNEVSSLKQILFEANEEDAAWMLSFLGNHVFELPWLLDTANRNGKLTKSNDLADDITFGEITKINDMYQIPVYLNNAHNGKLSAKFKLNNEIVNVVANKQLDENQLMSSFGTNIVTFAGFGEFTKEEPIVTLYIKANTEIINATEVRVNNEDKSDLSVISSLNTQIVNNDITSTPNPLSNNTEIVANINNTANYKVAIYDIIGNEVKLIVDGILESGLNTFSWDRTNKNNVRVNSGVYIFRIEGNGTSINTKLIVE